MINFSPSSPKIAQFTECKWSRFFSGWCWVCEMNGKCYYNLIGNPQKDVLERIIEQNKAIWNAILKVNKKLDNLTGVQKKMIREDSLGKNFWEVIILKLLWPLTSLFLKYFSLQIAARKICSLLAKETMYPPPEEFKRSLEEYLDQKFPCYIQDIGKHRWETKFYSELITMVSFKNSVF